MEEFRSLENYDISNPMKVTLIFDDCDEDTKPSVDVLDKNILNANDTSRKDNLYDTKNPVELALNAILTPETRKRTFQDYEPKTKYVSPKKEYDRANNKKIAKTEILRTAFEKSNDDNKDNKKIPSLNKNKHNSCNQPKVVKNNVEKKTKKKSDVETIAKNKRDSLDMPLLNQEEDLLNSCAVDNIIKENNDRINNNQSKVDNQGLKKVKFNIKQAENKKSSKETVIDSSSSSVTLESHKMHCYRNTENNKNVNGSTKVFATSTSTPNEQKKEDTEMRSPLKNIETKKTLDEQTASIENTNIIVDIPEKTSGQVGEPILNELNLNTTNTTIPEVANNDTAQNITRLLLENVSEHLVYIWTASQPLLKLINSSKGINKPKKCFVDSAKYVVSYAKQHYFDLSYSSTINIILPRENDINFLKTFIDSTVKLAHSQSHYSCSHQDIKKLLKELINWVKMRKQNVDKMQEMVNLQTSHPLLQQMLVTRPYSSTLAAPALKYTSSNKVTDITNNTPTNTFQSSPYHDTSPMTSIVPVQMSQSNAKQLPPYPYSHPPQHLYSQSHYQPAAISTPITRNQFQNRHQANQPTLPTFNRILDTINDAALSIQKPVEYQRTPLENNITKQNATQNVPSLYGRQPAHGLQSSLATNQRYENRIVSSSQNNQPLWPEYSRPGYQQVTQPRPEQFRIEQFRAEQVRPEQIRFNQFRADQIRPEQIELEQQEPININVQLPEPQRSSLSRDSGIISPLNFNGTNDQTGNMIQEELRAEVTPLITHVTSLNSSAAFIREGFCCVCSKPTKTMCVGCYNCYYCSSECQYRDWNAHVALCKPT